MGLPTAVTIYDASVTWPTQYPTHADMAAYVMPLSEVDITAFGRATAGTATLYLAAWCPTTSATVGYWSQLSSSISVDSSVRGGVFRMERITEGPGLVTHVMLVRTSADAVTFSPATTGYIYNGRTRG